MAIVARNWRCDLGEIDVVATEGDGLVLVEVKTRRTTTYGYPEESVGDAKLRRLRRLLARFLDESGMHPRWVRLDVVSVLLPRRGGPVISHLRDVS